MQFSGHLKTILFSALVMTVSCGKSQSLKDHLQKGDRYYEKKDFENASKSYLEALALDGDDARVNFKAGISLLNAQAFDDALQYLDKSYRLNPEIDPNIEYHLAMASQENHQFAKAREYFEAFKAKHKNLSAVANQKIQECILADSLMKIASNATVRPLESINTQFAEIAPLISQDGAMLIFTSNRSSDHYQIKSGTNYDDVYYSERVGNAWSEPITIGAEVNVKLNDAAVSVSADGNTLFLYYEEGKGDIYTSSLVNGEWSVPVPLNRFVNHPHYRESGACVSPDGTLLYFSSNRPGGKGGYDIYVCKLQSNGQWGRPSNLGSVINTRGDEEFPFLHADGNTLYFSSNGLPTLGSHDIYKSTLRDGHWSTPEHLGYPINTRGNEANFSLSEDKTTAYFSSSRGGSRRNMDLYAADFSPSVPASQAETTGIAENKQGDKIITVLKGTVIDVTTIAPLTATIRLVDHSTHRIVSTIETNASGNFELIIPRGGNYGVTTDKAGYLFNSMNFNLPAFGKYQEIDTHILMVKAEVGSKVVLKNIFFDSNQSALKPESLSELENIRDLLLRNPEWRIRINGHTDNVGHPKINRELSMKRAESVVQYLITAGISPDRLQAKGFGADKPLVSNDDEAEGRQLNRRTEIEIID